MQSGERARVFVVDDDATTRLLTVEALREAGFEVFEADCGEAALRDFERLAPDLVLLDVLMPGLDGFATCRRLREERRGERVPIIMMTGLEGSDSIERAYDAGATDFIRKPINWALLRHRVRYVLRGAATTEALAASEARLLQAQQVARMGNWNWSAEGERLSFSKTYPALFGTVAADISPRLEAALAHVHPADRDSLAEALASLREGQPYQLEYRSVWPDGTVHTLRDIAVPEIDESGRLRGAHGIVQDISEQAEAERRIRALAYFDALTGLPNRNAFREALAATLLRARRQRTVCTVLLFDLHRFGWLNDSLGRDAADHVLQLVAMRLREFCRAELGAGDVSDDTELAVAARYGPDQFALMLAGRDGLAARAVAARLRALVEAPLRVDRHALSMKCSVGLASSPEHARDAEALLKSAEIALRQAKRDSAAPSVLEFTSRMNDESLGRLRIETSLRAALERGHGLAMYYQPKLDLRHRCVVGAEALLRWIDPVLGIQSPADFLPLAEETGLIVPLSEWVIDAVGRQVAAWRDRGLPRLPVAINLSASHFRFTGLPGTIAAVLGRNGLDGRDIEFEITESALMGDPQLARQILDEIRGSGLSVAIDDFGTGYSSLAYLKRFPLSVLKIDRSFVHDIETDRSDAAIVAAIVAMAHSLELGLVAEGVETAAQARHLQRLGCHVMQGDYFAAPMPAERYAEVLARGLQPWPAE